MTTPKVVPLTPAEYAALKRCTPLNPRADLERTADQVARGYAMVAAIWRNA